MKITKVLVLLFIIMMNQFVSNLETSNKLLSLHRKIKIRRNSGKSSTTFGIRTHRSNLTSKMLKSEMKRHKAMAQMKFVFTTFFLCTNLILKVGTDIMTHFINKANQETLNIMKEEQSHNTNTLITMKEREIESCATIKLIIQSNKHFFLLADFKSIFFKYYQLRLQDSSFVDKLNEYDKLILPRIQQTVNDLVEIRTKMKEIEEDLLESITDIENDLCSQEVNYIDFQKRNDVLEGKINQMEKLLEEKEDSFIGTLFTGGWSGIKNYIRKNWFKQFADRSGETGDYGEIFEIQKELNEKGENGFGTVAWKDLSAPDADKKFEGSSAEITKTVGRFGASIGYAKELISAITDVGKQPNGWVGGFNIVAKAIMFLGSICNLINAFVPGGEVGAVTGLLAAVFELIAKLIEVVLAGYKLAKTTKDSSEYLVVKDEFYKALIELGVAFVSLFFAGFAGLATEGLTFFKKIGDLISAYRRKRQQTIELNYYKTLADLKIKDQQNLNNFNICLANLLTMRSQFKTILELTSGEETLQKTLSEAGENIANGIISEDKSGLQFYEEKGKQLLKEEVNLICHRNLQFCSRNFDTEFLKNLGFADSSINHMVTNSIYGPYSDIVVSLNSGTSISFLKLGYEPIAETILGCRMCSPNYVIRHIKIISDAENNEDIKKERAKLSEGKNVKGEYIGKALYNDEQVEKIKSYSEFEFVRLDTNHYIYYEFIHPTKIELALSRLFYYPMKNPVYDKNDWVPVFQAELSHWEPQNKKWVTCPSRAKCDRVYPHVNEQEDDFSVIITYHEQIKDGESVNLFNHPQYGGRYSNTVHNNLMLVPVGDYKETLDPEFRITRGDRKEFTYLVNNTSKKSEIKNKYLSAKKETRELTLSINKPASLKSNHYNWIIKNANIEMLDLQDGMSIYAPNAKIYSIDIKGLLTIPKNKIQQTDQISTFNDENFGYYLYQFEPFTNKNKPQLDDQQINPNCDTVCENSNPNNSCPSMDMSFNSWRKLNEEDSINIWEKIEEPTTFKMINFYGGSNGINRTEHGGRDNPFATISLSREKDTFFGKKKEKVFNFDDEQLLHVRHYKLVDFPYYRSTQYTPQQEIIKKENLNKYLLIEKEFAKKGKDREYDILRLFIIKKEEIKNDDFTDKLILRYMIKLEHIDDNIYLVATTNASKVKAYLKLVILKMKGFTIVHRTILRKDNPNNQRYVFVMIKPLPSSGYLPQIDLTKTKLLSFSTSQACIVSIYRSIHNDFALKSYPNGRARPENFIYYEADVNHINLVYFDFFFHKYASPNLTKLMYRKLFPNPNKIINAETLFCQQGYTDCYLFEHCSKSINFTIPISFKISKNEKKNLYRVLEIDSDGSIVPKLSSKGPGIGSIYWLSISTVNSISDLSVKNLNSVLSSGFSFYKETKWRYRGEIDLFVKIYVNYDFRLKIDKEEICKLCNNVKDKFKNPPKNSLTRDSAEIMQIYEKMIKEQKDKPKK